MAVHVSSFQVLIKLKTWDKNFVYEKSKKVQYIVKKAWMVPMISRNMLIALQDREKFLKNCINANVLFGVKTALLYVFKNSS